MLHSMPQNALNRHLGTAQQLTIGSFKVDLLFKSKRSADMNDNYTRFIVNILRIDKWVNFFYKLHYGISFLSKSTPHGPLIWIQ